MLKNTIYIMILTVVLTAVYTLCFVGIWPTTPAWIIAYLTICCLFPAFMGHRTAKISHPYFGRGTMILIFFGWVSHCVFYAVLITVAVKMIPGIFA